MSTLNDDPMGTTLAALAVVEAFLDRDRERLDALMGPGQDVTAIVQRILHLFEVVLTSASGGHPHRTLQYARAQLLAKLTENGNYGQ